MTCGCSSQVSSPRRPWSEVNSSYCCNIVLEKGLLPDIRAMSSLQVDTAAGWIASAHRPDHDGLSEKEHINFIEPHKWPPNSVIHGINIRAIWRPHVSRFNEVYVLFFR